MFRYLDEKSNFKILTPDKYLSVFEANETEKSREVTVNFEKNIYSGSKRFV